MEYLLVLILAGLVALWVAVLRGSRPHPRHDFLFEMVARLAPGDVVSSVPGGRAEAGSGEAKPRASR